MSFWSRSANKGPKEQKLTQKQKAAFSQEVGVFRELPRMEFLLNWCFIDPTNSIVFNTDNSMFCVFTFRGPDMDSATPAEMMQYMAGVNNALKSLGTGYTLYFDAQRHVATSYDKSQMPCTILQEMEDEREAYYSSAIHYETSFYFVLYHEPPAMLRKKLTGAFVQESKDRAAKDASKAEEDLKLYKKTVTDFQNAARLLTSMLEHWFKDMRLLNVEETLSYLHNIVSDKRISSVKANNLRFIKEYITDATLTCGRDAKLGEKHMRAITILNFPPISTPGLLNVFNSIDFEYRWVSRYICLSKVDAQKELEAYQKRWAQQVKGMFTQIKEACFPETRSDENIDEHAIVNAEDSRTALMELNQDYVSYGFYTMTMFVFDENKERCEELANRVLEKINTMGFVGYIETDNTIEAWRGSLPGFPRCNIRRPIVNSLNFCHMAPATATWSGDRRNDCLKGPVLLYTDSSGYTPFRLSLHVGDVGHTMITGPSGSGKSVLLNTIEAHFLKYPNSNVFIFDKAASSRALTYAVGGNFYNLAAEGANDLSFQPLSHIDDDQERKWAKDWILSYLSQKNMTITPYEDNIIWKALGSLIELPAEARTISELCHFTQDPTIRQGLNQLTREGAYGSLFDNSHDFSGEGRWQVFEMETLMNTPAIVPATLDYLFHRIEKKLSTATGPSIIVLDECWLFFDNPAFRGKLREYFKDMRKKNTSIIFATQNLADVASKTDLLSTVMENCPNRIYLPNVNAANEQNSVLYQVFGCNSRQIELISEMTPKRDYYYSSEKGNRVFRLALQPAELPFITATNKSDQQEMNRMVADGRINNFVEEWLKYKKDPLTWQRMQQIPETLPLRIS